MRIWVGNRVVHLESMSYPRLCDYKTWLKKEIDKFPSMKETNMNKIQLINKEIARKDLQPLTYWQKRNIGIK